MDLQFISFGTLLAFAGACVVLILTPGPDMIYVLTRGAAQGRRAGVVAGCGLSVGVLGHTTMAALGLAALLEASTVLYVTVKLLGALFLLYVGVKMMLSGGRVLDIAPDQVRGGSLRRLFFESVFTNLLNPKVALFFIAFVPQFVDANRGMVALQMMQLGLVMAVLSMLLKTQIGFFAGSIHGYLDRRAQLGARVQRGAGAIIALLGLHVGLSR